MHVVEKNMEQLREDPISDALNKAIKVYFYNYFYNSIYLVPENKLKKRQSPSLLALPILLREIEKENEDD